MLDEKRIVQEIIPEKLREIEKSENVRILYCAESGSRAWGFASPDSDFDVRFIYVRPKEFYLKLEQTRDVIEWQLDDTLDINGWDLRKALILLHKSNPTIFEWANSPIIYRTTSAWEAIAGSMDGFFQKKACLYHYLSMAKTNDRAYLQGETVKLKKYFYVLRPILSCRWILEKGTPPPVLFDELVRACLDSSLRQEVERLIARKKTTPESGEEKHLPTLQNYLKQSIAEIDGILKTYPRDDICHWEELNRLFLHTL